MESTKDVKMYRCNRCNRTIRDDNVPRHERRCLAKAATSPPSEDINEADNAPVEFLNTISEVLQRCNIDPELLLAWNIQALDTLPNMRNLQPTPRYHHTAWRIYADSTVGDLPSLEDLLVDVSCVARSPDFGDLTTQVWDGETPVKFSPDEWRDWPKRLLEGRTLTTRVFNMPAHHVIAQSKTGEFANFASTIVNDIYQPPTSRAVTRLPPDFIISPRLTKTELHHDNSPGVALAIGSSKDSETPLKLWLVWPSTELHHMASRSSDTASALEAMGHGCFVVQMPGDTIAVPGNSPHSVLALRSCYVYGHVFQMRSEAYDPPVMQVELRVTTSPETAYRSCIQQLISGLAHPEFRQAHIDRFTQSWIFCMASIHATRYASFFDQLVKIWSEDISTHRSCAWCIATGLEHDIYIDVDPARHARAHLEGRAIPAASTEEAPSRKRRKSYRMDCKGRKLQRAV